MKLVGRGSHLRVLEREYQRAAVGKFRCAIVLADAGLGKTRLARELVGRASRKEIGYLWVRAHPFSRTTPFSVWIEALERHMRELPTAEIVQLCGAFLDDLSNLLGPAATVRACPPVRAAPRPLLLRGLAEVLTKLTERGPLIVVLDDFHLADEFSWELLNYVAFTYPRVPLLVVATARPADLLDQHVPARILHDLEEEDLLTRLSLGPLTPADIAELAHDSLGTQAPPSLIDWLFQRSRGNPFFALTLLTALLESDADVSDPKLAEPPQPIHEYVGSVLQSLSQAELRTLQFIAVIARRAALEEMLTLTQRSLDTLAGILHSLTRKGLINEEEQDRRVTYEVAHPLIQEEIYRNLGAAQRRLIHLQIGEHLLGDGHWVEAAQHLARSSQPGDASVVERICAAICDAESHGSFGEVLAILLVLVELLPPHDQHWATVARSLSWKRDCLFDQPVDVGGVLYAMSPPLASGRVIEAPEASDQVARVGPSAQRGLLCEQALREIDQALAVSPHCVEQAVVSFHRANVLARKARDLDAARRVYESTVGLFRELGDDAGALLAANEIAWVQGASGDLEAWERGMREVARAAGNRGEAGVEIRALGGLGFGAFIRGQFTEAEDMLRRSITLARSTAKHSVPWNQLLLAWSLGFEGRLPEAFELVEEAKSSLPARSNAVLLEWEPMLDWLAGDFLKVLSYFERTLAQSPSSGNSKMASGLVVASICAIEADEIGKAKKYLELARSLTVRHTSLLSRDYSAYPEALLLWHNGNWPEAVLSLEVIASRLIKLGALPFAAFVLTDLIECASGIGNKVIALEARVKLDDIARTLNRWPYHALSVIGQSACGAVPQVSLKAGESALQVASTCSKLGYKALLGRALLELGRSSGDADTLQEAAAALEATGSRWRRSQVGQVLHDRPAGRKRAEDHFRALLSPREHEVAQLATLGLSSRQIANRLFLSKRTVENHLYRVYSKCGVSNRADLRAALTSHQYLTAS